MRQSVLFLIGILLFALTACNTAPIDEFGKIKVGMDKDDVLELVGNPLRTERFDGQEKWAYRYYTGPDKDVEQLRQVTFELGKVVSVGEDTAEESRLKDIQKDDEERALRRKAEVKKRDAEQAEDEKTGRIPGNWDDVTPQTAAPQSAAPAVQPDEEVKSQAPDESDFVEIKGKRGPVKKDDNSGDQ